MRMDNVANPSTLSSAAEAQALAHLEAALVLRRDAVTAVARLLALAPARGAPNGALEFAWTLLRSAVAVSRIALTQLEAALIRARPLIAPPSPRRVPLAT